MKIELKNREKSAYKKLCCTQSAKELKEDIVVPDTLEDILRILSCTHQCRIRSKNVEQDCVLVGGELDVTVLYIPETGDGIQTISTVIPFELRLDAPGADSTSVSIIDTSVLNIDVKTVNPRKVSVSADICITQSCHKYLDMAWAEAPDTSTEKLFIKPGEVDYQGIVLATEKMLSLEEDLQLPDNIQNGEFISACSSITVDSSEVIGSKLIVKGRAEIEALYIVSSAPETAAFSIGFSQLFELPEDVKEPSVRAACMVTGQYFEPLGEKLAADIRGVIQIICTEQQHISYIEDAYACGMELGIDKMEFQYLQSASCTRGSESLSLSYNTDYGANRILCSRASCSAVDVSDSQISVPVTADIVYEDSEGALRSCRVRGTAEIPYQADEGSELESARIKSVKASARADETLISITVSIEAEFSTATHSSVSMINDINAEACEPGSRAGASAYMCKALDGDLWSIAKKYGSDVRLIKEINSLEDDECACGRLLLIPVVR